MNSNLGSDTPALAPRVRHLLLADAVLSRGMDALTGGAVLAGLGLWVGAGNLMLAVLAALPFLAQVAQLGAVAVLLRWTNRRRIVVLMAGAARLLLLAVAAILFLHPAWLSPGRLVGILAVAALLAVVATAAWNWWMRDLVPPGQLGALFGRRMQGSTVVALAAILGSGALLDAFARAEHEALGYGVLFAAGGLVGLVGIAVLSATPHVTPPPSTPARNSLALIPHALRTSQPALVASLSLSTAAASLALPFAAVYLLRGLGYSYLLTATMAAVSQVAYLLGLRGWGHVSDRYGDRPLLSLSMGILGLSLLLWAGAGWTGLSLTLWLLALHFLAGFALGGIELANTNILLRAPGTGPVAARLASLSLVRAACGGAAVLSAGLLWHLMGAEVLWSVQLPVIGLWALRGFQVLCLGSAALCIAAMIAVHKLPRLEGRGLTQVARSLRSEVHQMSSIAGVRGLIHAVSYSVEFLARPFAARPGSGPPPDPRSATSPPEAEGDGR